MENTVILPYYICKEEEKMLSEIIPRPSEKEDRLDCFWRRGGGKRREGKKEAHFFLLLLLWMRSSMEETPLQSENAEDPGRKSGGGERRLFAFFGNLTHTLLAIEGKKRSDQDSEFVCKK